MFGKTAWALLCALMCTGVAHADTLYRCKGYGGGVFWSKDHCQQHQALVDRIATVPSGISYDQQVKVAEQGTRATAKAVEQASQPSRAEKLAAERQARARAKHQAKCDKLHQELELQTSRARQGGSGNKQKRIAERQRKLREEGRQANCPDV